MTQDEQEHLEDWKKLNPHAEIISSKPVTLITTKSDYNIAEELKQEMIAASIASCAVLDKAIKLGFQMNVSFGQNQINKKFQIVQLVVSKVF